jgi:hypothetical protein
MSKDEDDKTIPVKPPIVNKKRNPNVHKRGVLKNKTPPYKDATHLKILIPVGTAITIVAAVKYARVSISIPTVNM